MLRERFVTVHAVVGNQYRRIGNFWGRGLVPMAGDDSRGHPAGTKTGDVIHVFRGGSSQMLTDVSIGPAGKVWAANNGDDPNAASALSFETSIEH
jgi:hypothetical protein